MSFGRQAWTWGAIACALTVARPSHAQSNDAFELEVTPDARGCITEAGLRARIAGLRARAEGARGLELAIDASRTPALLEVRRDGLVIATRSFDALPERCSERLQTVALVVTLALEHAVAPDAGGDELPAPEAEAPVVEAEAPPPPADADPPPAQTEAVASASDEPERREPALRAIVGVGAAYGLLPELAGLLAIGVEVPSAWLRVGLGALATSEVHTSLAGGTALTRLAAGRAYGCAAGPAFALDLEACAGVTLGVVAGTGRDYAPNRDATGTLIAPLLRLGARFPERGTFAVGFALEAFASIVRPELEISGNAGARSSSSPFGASLSLEGALAVP